MTLGTRLRFLRTKEHYTQEEVAQQLGVSRQVISKWELDKSLPDLRQVTLLGELYHISLDELILGRKATPSENFRSRLQAEWQQLVSAFPLIPLEEYWLKGANLQLTHLGKESQIQMSLLEALDSGQRVGVVWLIRDEYFPRNSFGNNGPKCLLELEEERMIVREFKHLFISGRSWPKNVPEVKVLPYQEIDSVVIGVERRTGKIWGLPSNEQPLFYLIVDLFVRNGEHWSLSCASLSVAPDLFHRFEFHQLTVNDPFGLKSIFINPQIEEPVSYLKKHYEELLPPLLVPQYDRRLTT